MTASNGQNVHRIETLELLPPRAPDGHKGDYGRVLVVGGSRGMVGAVALAANAALRGGAGLVTFAAPQPVQLTIAGLAPCATSIALACDDAGLLAPEAEQQLAGVAAGCDVFAVGCGWGVGSGQKDLLAWALGQSRPMVCDADGLNNLAGLSGWQTVRSCPLILTPHPGEMARLTGRDASDIQSDRETAARQAVLDWAGSPRPGCAPFVVVLKGAGTVVTDGRRVYVNDTGNPGMATGGAGDVLTGLIAALLGQGMLPFEAACLGVYAHGLAGDLAAAALGRLGLIASDLLDFLPAALEEAHGRPIARADAVIDADEDGDTDAEGD
ncbi:MAG: NAD(P)H-hydrate dehydratase [Phycisphaerae bacterium]|nr:NAD(P)H-hydrate dehydratase [Phycisphaerae bacterium]